MKRLRFTTVLLTIALSLTISAQKTCLPMLEEGRVWNVVWLHPWDASGEYREGYYQIGPELWYKGSESQLSIQGDTVFDGRIYKKMVDGYGKFIYAFYQEGCKIYRFHPSEKTELLYDFGLEEGDTFRSIDGLDYMVSKVDTIHVKGVDRKRLKIDRNDGESKGFVDYWVEGIGCSGVPYFTYWFEVIGSYPQMLSCYQGDELLFEKSDFNAPGVKETQEEEYEIDDNDYKPFVEIGDPNGPGKSWRVIHTMPGEITDSTLTHSWLSENYYFDKYQLENGEVVRGDNTYFNLKCYGAGPVREHLRNPDPNRKNVLLREKERKVYVYSEKDQKEYLLYDFSLKEGDTFTSYDIDAGETVNLKVLSAGQLDDGPRLFPTIKHIIMEKRKKIIDR